MRRRPPANAVTALLVAVALHLGCGTADSVKKRASDLALEDDSSSSKKKKSVGDEPEDRNGGDIELQGTPTRGEEPPPENQGGSNAKPAPDNCTKDAECNQAGRICDATSHTCVKGCRGTGASTCPEHEVCQSGQCKPQSPSVECYDDYDCYLGEVCTTQGACVEGCYSDYDCPTGQTCTSTPTAKPPTGKQCVPKAIPVGTSTSSSGSSGTSGSSGGTHCSSDGACNPGNNGSGMICSAQGYCVPGCRTDAQCPGIKICDAVTKQCR